MIVRGVLSGPCTTVRLKLVFSVSGKLVIKDPLVMIRL